MYPLRITSTYPHYVPPTIEIGWDVSVQADKETGKRKNALMLFSAAAGSGVIALCRLVLVGSPLRSWPSCAAPRSRSSSSIVHRCSAALQPSDVPRLAETARISLSSQEVKEFEPKIRQVIDWFGQLQAVNLESIDPSLRADTEVSASPREDFPETFENREALISAVPRYSDPYIKVPKVISKE
ncbi:glutamyl-tRNA(Gln) amidotransferase subunit C, chloroplastic/mitochondrial isoform X2 [Phoenix dactylifera]|uniref:Glutamyl-tRNA(Gln) amidotransferase subunit C, chloroplastic/mitochondrial n=1 Tax=Phoenix dactylifera TaxID=42345 RepID=A0A8B7CY39_PHODC|nr:glutamyl-tRNA(Gln) amidotransferase subunit C, chloroplastic/mitochondrial isoform X2 [Phoenix dactylifera]